MPDSDPPIRIRSPFGDDAFRLDNPVVVRPGHSHPGPVFEAGDVTHSPEIEAVTIKLPSGSKPGSPTNVVVEVGSNGVVLLAWTPVNGAQGYQVQTAGGVEVKTILPGTADATALVLASGNYGLTAFNAVGESTPTAFAVP